jgi:hypothetical protein
MEATGLCPNCDEGVAIQDPEIDDETECPECAANLIVACVKPLTFKEAMEEDEEDDEDEFLDDDSDDDDEEDDDEFDDTDDEDDDEE